MSNPDLDRTRIEAEDIHRARLSELIELGIYGLIFQHGNYSQIGGDIMQINSEFNGEPIVRLKASRSKQGEETFYREEVELIYDGSILSINGAHPIFSGQIPTDETVREEVIGRQIKDAFGNPKRKIITGFDPRKFY